MKVDCYHFEIHGGTVPHEEREGKVHWPNQLTIEMDRWHAFNLITEILSQLQEGKKIITSVRCGALDHTSVDDV